VDTTQVPRALLVAVAQATTGTVRAVVDHPPDSWRTDPAPYVTVRQPSPFIPGLRGDDTALAYLGSVQVDLWERRGTEDPALLVAVLAALIDTPVGQWGKPRFEEVVRVPDEDPDIIHHAIGLRYAASR
jgi:hypothetical protein